MGFWRASCRLAERSFLPRFVLPGVLSEFSHRYPQIKIDLQEGTTTQLTDKLVAEELDLLIDNSELDDKNYEKVLL